jgi:CheY-like chemotaxis protein
LARGGSAFTLVMNSGIKRSPKETINKLVFEQNYKNSINLDINETFSIFLYKMQSRQENTNSPSRLDSSSRKLMAVDDEADITFTLKKELEQSGFSLDVFNDPLAALSNFKADYYDLILLDIKMPQMNGYELYQEIKKKDDKVKVCFVTASDVYLESLKQRFPRMEVGCLIRKPIDTDDLVKRINKELFESNKG